MICRWCKGSGQREELPCEHCDGSGQMTDPPFGSPQLRDVLCDEDVNTFAHYWCDSKRDETLGQFIQRVAQYAIDVAQHQNKEDSL